MKKVRKKLESLSDFVKVATKDCRDDMDSVIAVHRRVMDVYTNIVNINQKIYK